MTQHAVLLGASKGCGYHALIRLLDPRLDWKATILLRKPESIENDPLLKQYLEEGRLKIVKGDATNYQDVVQLFVEKVDVVISTIGKSRMVTRAEDIGAAPVFSWKGLSIDQPRLCIDAAIVLIKVLQTLPTQPRVIVTSSMGIGKDHSNLPYILGVRLPLLSFEIN
jgi:NAD(P)-dependent dehydrogenase (short-subunit alcohol dehydrogenase family)